MIVLNYIKPNMNQKFEKLTLNDVLPVVAEYRDPDDIHALNQKALEEMRFMRPRSQNKDKSWSYVFIGDPYIDEATISLPNLSFKNMVRRMLKTNLKKQGGTIASIQVRFLIYLKRSI